MTTEKVVINWQISQSQINNTGVATADQFVADLTHNLEKIAHSPVNFTDEVEYQSVEGLNLTNIQEDLATLTKKTNISVEADADMIRTYGHAVWENLFNTREGIMLMATIMIAGSHI